MILNSPYLFITNSSIRSAGLQWPVVQLHWQLCFALHYLNTGWFWGCPSAVVTAPALWLLCSIKWLSLFLLFFFFFLSCEVWSRGNAIFTFPCPERCFFNFWNCFLALSSWKVTREGGERKRKRSEIWPPNMLSRCGDNYRAFWWRK